MNLERRTFLVIFVTLVAATGLAFAVAQAAVFHSVQALEEKRAHENVQRVSEALQYDLDRMNDGAGDWAHWDDAYAFVQGAGPDFVDANLVPGTFHLNHVDVMIFFDAAGHPVSALAHTPGQDSLHAAPADLLAGPLANPLLRAGQLNQSTSGILIASGGPIMVSAWPILPTHLDAAPAGVLVWGRFLDGAEVNDLARRTLLEVSVRPWPDVAARPGYAEVAQTPDQPVIELESSSALVATAPLHDLLGQPALALEVRMDRPIYQQSVQNLAFGLASTILVGGAILVLITTMLDRSVFTPLHRLTRDVEALGTGATGGRVRTMRDDEIGQLAASFNRLMGRIDRDKIDLERSNQDLRDFAAVVSHDLQPPLSTIALNAAVVRERERSRLDPDAMQRLERLETTALRMAQHIRSILDYSRVASQAAPMQEVNLNDVMEEVVNDLEERLHATGGRIEYRSLPRLPGNRTQLLQLLLNLMGNGLKYHRPGVPPIVKVHAEPYSDGKGWVGFRVVVEDNGIGFDPTELDRMVRPYTRLEHRVEGYGLGLATCHKIIQRHHGRLSAHSVPGQGSAFLVDLPATQPGDGGHAPAPAEA
ncbi:MAG: CHASE4 domain-containing protein [bacterium]